MTTNERLTPVAQEIVPKLRQRNRIEGRSRALTWSIVAALVVVFASVVYLVAHAQTTDEVTDRLAREGQARDAQISGIQDQLKGVCRKVPNPASLTPQEREGCFRAENDIPPPVPVTITGTPVQSGLSAAQVQALIADALAQMPRPLTVEQVAATAQQVFAANAASLEPSPAKLADAVSGFCSQDACRGPQGAKGDPAPAVSDEQIRTQVDAFCAENGGCVGPSGPTGSTGPRGAQGISVQAFSDPHTDPADPSKCVITVTLIDPEVEPPNDHPKVDFNVPRVFCLPG